MRIGIDVGTSMTKAVLYDEGMTGVAVRSRPTPVQRPAPGRYEHDLDGIVDAVVELLTELPGNDVDLVAITGQGDGLWLVDTDGGAVAPAVSWMDDRGSFECERWSASGVTETLFRRTGNAPFPGAGAALLAAQQRIDPAVLNRAATATQCQHAVFQALTGGRVATRSAAMLGVFDPATGGYDQEALRLTGLDRHVEMLPDFCGDPVAVAPLRPDVATRAGLPDGAVAASGPYDLPAAAFGAGVTEPGDGLLIVGTTLACLVRQDAVTPAGEPAGLTLRTANDRGYLRAMPAMVGTAGLDWVLGLVGARHQDLESLLQASEPGAGGVAALPYVSPAGERAPFVDPRASGQFTGLSLATTPADLVRAYCEALAYAARHCFDAAGLTGGVTLCGGGTASAGLTALFATVLGRPVTVAQDPECTARGAVAAAAAAPPTPPIGRAVDPSDQDLPLYQAGYDGYLDRMTVARDRGWDTGPRPPSSAIPGAPMAPATQPPGPRALVKE